MEIANKYKPDYIGFVFAESPRKVSYDQARELSGLLSEDIVPVGVFVNEHMKLIVDLIYQIQGEPEEVIPLNCSTGTDGISSEDYGMAVFKYKNGVSFAKTNGSEYGGFLRRQLVICGERGSIEIKPLEVIADNGVYTVLNDYCTDSWTDPWRTEKTEVYPRYDVMMKNFAELICGKENPYSYDYELNLYKLILKACGNEIK